MKPLCIYHGNCADGFGAAWAVWKALGDEVEFFPGVYGEPPPQVAGADVIMVDFSYKRPVLDDMQMVANSLLILDHHKTAAEDLRDFPKPRPGWGEHLGYLGATGQSHICALFDMDRSGAVMAWEFFHPGKPVPRLLQHVQEWDLWLFKLPETREILAAVFSHPYEFARWSTLVTMAQTMDGIGQLRAEGEAIERKHHKDIAELVPVTVRAMTIGGHVVHVANLPYTLASDAGNKLAREGSGLFGATYYDGTDKRFFSLRSVGDFDVSAIAKQYGGGGHKNAAGFFMPLGWEGDTVPAGRRMRPDAARQRCRASRRSSAA